SLFQNSGVLAVRLLMRVTISGVTVAEGSTRRVVQAETSFHVWKCPAASATLPSGGNVLTTSRGFSELLFGALGSRSKAGTDVSSQRSEFPETFGVIPLPPKIFPSARHPCGKFNTNDERTAGKLSWKSNTNWLNTSFSSSVVSNPNTDPGSASRRALMV